MVLAISARRIFSRRKEHGSAMLGGVLTGGKAVFHERLVLARRQDVDT